jgi:hypothetical protein
MHIETIKPRFGMTTERLFGYTINDEACIFSVTASVRKYLVVEEFIPPLGMDSFLTVSKP